MSHVISGKLHECAMTHELRARLRNLEWSFLGACILAMVATPCFAEQYVSADLSDGGKVLTITTASGSTHILRTGRDEANFSDVKVSSDEHVVGWLVEKYCCGSFPYAVALLIFSDGKVVQRFDDESIFLAWRFERHDTAVGYATQTAHFATGTGYSLRSIASGKRLQFFGCDIPYDGERHAISRHVPHWVWSLRDAGNGHCPYADTNLEE